MLKLLLFLLVLGLNFLGVIIGLTTGGILLLVARISKSTSLHKYGFNILVSYDQNVNALMGGDMDETISSRMGKWAEDGRNKSGGRKVFYALAYAIVERFEKDHFKKSIEKDEGEDEIVH